MFKFMMPVDYWRTAVTVAAISIEAHMVIAMRTMGMIGLWNVDRSENLRMMAEKAHAAAESGRAASGAVWRGGGPGAATYAALKPIRSRTRSNVRRLHKRGPKSTRGRV